MEAETIVLDHQPIPELIADNDDQPIAELIADNDDQSIAELIADNDDQPIAELIADNDDQPIAELIADINNDDELIIPEDNSDDRNSLGSGVEDDDEKMVQEGDHDWIAKAQILTSQIKSIASEMSVDSQLQRRHRPPTRYGLMNKLKLSFGPGVDRELPSLFSNVVQNDHPSRHRNNPLMEGIKHANQFHQYKLEEEERQNKKRLRRLAMRRE
ncbi:uncharacterized protein [Antedon mediterranea]|uniref:uncharacterized protein n=1 Tax=Antedon mediterranea TaxID=105859 RepID=UPI003AF5D996